MRLSLPTVVLFGFSGFLGLHAGHAPAQVYAPQYIVPPPANREVVTEAPSAQHVWVPGHWNRTPDEWQWTGGAWMVPPAGNAYWVDGYWQHRGGQFEWEPAHWATAQQGVIVNKPVNVPKAYQEAKPAAPAASSMAWQPGHWDWRGTWVWEPGAYVATTVSKSRWVNGKWIAGADGQWRWMPAHWEAQ